MKEGYEGITIAGLMLAAALVVISILKFLF
jgi:hypothetical protein